MTTITNIDDCFPSRYLTGSDIAGQAHTLTISAVVMTEMTDRNGQPEHKPVIYFEGCKKGLVLNFGNKEIIKEAYGPDPRVWTGRQILLTTERELAFGKMTDCLKVHVPGSEPAPAPPPIAPPSELPGTPRFVADHPDDDSEAPF